MLATADEEGSVWTCLARPNSAAGCRACTLGIYLQHLLRCSLPVGGSRWRWWWCGAARRVVGTRGSFRIVSISLARERGNPAPPLWLCLQRLPSGEQAGRGGRGDGTRGRTGGGEAARPQGARCTRLHRNGQYWNWLAGIASEEAMK
jgi:hypothetical protein